MKIAAMMTMAAMLGSVAWAADKPGEQKVVVCFEESGGNLAEAPQARMLAAELFRSAGVKLVLLTGRRSCEGQGDHVIVVSLSMNTPSDLRPGALAYARPFEGVHILVFRDRIANGAHSRHLRPHLLAYVMVHEITHVLEGLDRHSESGIMKADWDAREHDLMLLDKLPFAEEDVALIRAGLAARAARRASGTLVAVAELR